MGETIIKLMQKIFIAFVVIAFGVGFIFMLMQERVSEVVYQTVPEEVIVDALNESIKSALVASSTEIEASAQKAYDNAKKQMELEIELAVRSKYREELEAKEVELQGQASF